MSETPPKDRKAKRPRPRGWRIFFSVFKWCRVAVLLLILGLVLALIFLHQAGLPVFLQERLVTRFREMGWDAQFSKLRLRWYRGIVAEQLALSRTNSGDGPHLFVDTAEFRLNAPAFRSLRLQADSMLLSEARLIWPLASTNRPRHTFVLERIHGELLFLPNDCWELRSLEGHALGFHLRVRGTLTNALLVRDWTRTGGPHELHGPGGETWAEILAQAKRIRPSVPPAVNVQFAADGRDPRSLAGTLKLTVPGVESPWGAATNLTLLTRLLPAPNTNAPMQAELKLGVELPRTPWGAASNLQLTIQWEPSVTALVPTNTRLSLHLEQPHSPWGRADQLTLQATNFAGPRGAMETALALDLRQPDTNPARARRFHFITHLVHPPDAWLPAQTYIEAETEQLETRWATSAWARVHGPLDMPALENLALFHTNLSWEQRLTNIESSLTFGFSNALAFELACSHVTLTNYWSAGLWRGEATVNTSAGELAVNCSFDSLTRAAHFNANARADPHAFARFLPPQASGWLQDYRSAVPLEVQAAGSARLPPWSSDPSRWRETLWPTLSIAGRVEAGAGTFREVPFTSARAIGLYTNGQWTLPELRVTRPEGAVEAEAYADTRTADFLVKVTSSILPHALRPAFPDEQVQRNVFDPFAFTVAPWIRGELRGNWRDWSTLSALAEASVSNAAVRTQAIGFASTHLEFTNQFLSLLHPMILREGRQRGEADGVGLDTRTKRLYLTNAQGNLDPMALAHALGPPIVRVLEPYVFAEPPHIRAHGLLPLRHGDDGEDAWFEVEGGPFVWWRIHADKVRAQVHWLGESRTVSITNLAARWRGSDAAGWLQLDFSKPKGGGMAFHIALEGADLGQVVQDLQNGRSNRLEGFFGGELNVTSAFLDDWNSWQGYGRADLREGLIWDVPLFAVLSPMLNAVIPGLGHSRAREGRATFVITNSVIHSRDLQIRASAMQLRYRGTIDFHGALDARMEAELFRNVPGLGVILSKVLWPVTKLFEYRVAGSLDSPKLDEMYFIPKIVLFPLQPIKTLKDLFAPDRDKEKDKATDKPPGPAAPATAPP